MPTKIPKKTSAKDASVRKRGRPRKTAATETSKKTTALPPVKSDVDEKSPIEIVSVKTAVPSKKDRYIYAIGRRKTAVAKIRAFSGASDIHVNKRPFGNYFQTKDLQKTALSPLSLLGLEKELGFEIFVGGGGVRAQAEAIRHGIARALIIRNPEDKGTLKKAGFLTRDPRVKERKKPGLKRARRGPQWAKR